MDCIFCRIAAGEIPATVVARNEHGAGLPRSQPAGADARAGDPVAPFRIGERGVPTRNARPVLGEVMRLAVQVAGRAWPGRRRLPDGGQHRQEGGQTVDHLHVHLLGGRQMHWPPG